MAILCRDCADLSCPHRDGAHLGSEHCFKGEAARKETRSHNVGESDYAKHKIQPWDIWLEYKLNPWDADIVKRVLREKATDTRRLDYEKIIHICQERIRQIDAGVDEYDATVAAFAASYAPAEPEPDIGVHGLDAVISGWQPYAPLHPTPVVPRPDKPEAPSFEFKDRGTAETELCDWIINWWGEHVSGRAKDAAPRTDTPDPNTDE